MPDSCGRSSGKGGSIMAKIVGIDLSTTNSVVAVVQNGEPVVIPQMEGIDHESKPALPRHNAPRSG